MKQKGKKETRVYNKRFKRYTGLTQEEIDSWIEYNKKHGLPETNRHLSVDSAISQKYYVRKRSV